MTDNETLIAKTRDIIRDGSSLTYVSVERLCIALEKAEREVAENAGARCRAEQWETTASSLLDRAEAAEARERSLRGVIENVHANSATPGPDPRWKLEQIHASTKLRPLLAPAEPTREGDAQEPECSECKRPRSAGCHLYTSCPFAQEGATIDTSPLTKEEIDRSHELAEQDWTAQEGAGDPEQPVWASPFSAGELKDAANRVFPNPAPEREQVDVRMVCICVNAEMASTCRINCRSQDAQEGAKLPPDDDPAASNDPLCPTHGEPLREAECGEQRFACGCLFKSEPAQDSGGPSVPYPAVQAVLDSLTDRKGFRRWWDNVDEMERLDIEECLDDALSPALQSAQEVDGLREALDGLVSACDAINSAQARNVIDPHALLDARAALRTGGDHG